MSARKKIDFSDMSARDFATLMMNNAIVGKESGHEVKVSNGTFNGTPGVLIVLPGFTFRDGQLKAVEHDPA